MAPAGTRPPPADVAGTFFNASGQVARRPSEIAGPDRRIDERAVYSVLQFNAVVPPFSPFRGVSRRLPGWEYPDAEAPRPVRIEPSVDLASLDLEEQSRELERLLDAALTEAVGAEKDPIVLFSGGVDSALIAARLAALGRRDTVLANYAFSPDDPESELAEAIAGVLGLRFERFERRRAVCDCLSEPGRLYAQPFSDVATADTVDLAYSVAQRFAGEHRPVLDGTGADGILGLTPRLRAWEHLLRLPKPVRAALAAAYPVVAWRADDRRARPLAAARRSVTVPLPAAVMTQNAMAGIVYDDGPAPEAYSALTSWIEGWAGVGTVARGAVAIDLALTCAGAYAQKAIPIFERAGIRLRFPYLSDEMVAAGVAAAGRWSAGEPKAALKLSLARHVRADMVYRPKRVFLDPARSVFGNPEFAERLRAAIDADGPIAGMLRRKAVLRACGILGKGEVPPIQTLNALWAIVFTDRWYRTVE